MERVLFCPGNRMIAYDWSGGKFGGTTVFSANESGYRAFEEYLDSSAYVPVNILVDLIEEEFNSDHVPYVWGSDRAAILSRTEKKYFRTSELRTLQVQNRQKTGRRDLEVLVSGLSNASILRRWMEILIKKRIPVRGIFSLPLLGQALLPAIKNDKKRVLLVSQQSPMTLRQSFYDDGYLKLSRLALHRVARDNSVIDVKYVETDVSNTLLYLRSQRLLRRNEALDVCVIVRDELYDAFDVGLKSDQLIHYHILRQSEMAQKIGIKETLPTDYADGLFAHILLKKNQLKNHYAPSDLTRFYRYHIARRALAIAAGLVLLGGIAFAAGRYYEVQLLHSYSGQARFQKNVYKRHYQERLGRAAAYRLAPDDVKSAVKTINVLQSYSQATPLAMLSGFAEIMTPHKNINLTRFYWVKHPKSNVEIGNNAAQLRSVSVGERREREGGFDYQVAIVEGRVAYRNNNYRYAVETFNAFVQDVEKSGQYLDILVLKTPFDIDPSTGVTGDSGTRANVSLATQSTFSLQITIKPQEISE